MSNPLAADLDHVLAHTEPLWSSIRDERIFLTGGTGFVGTWLTESLLWANRRLDLGISAVLLTRNPAAFAKRSPHLAADPAVELLSGDAASFAYPAGTFPLIIHAACTGTFSRDVAATSRVLDLAGTRGTRRLLFTSSGAVYGQIPPDASLIAETYPVAPATTDANSSYGQAKRVSEFLCCGHAWFRGFDALIARLFAFTGPYLPLGGNYAAGNFIRDLLAGGPVRIMGDGTPRRSYLYAADLAIWLWTILFRGKPSFPYNVGSPDAVTIAELARLAVAVNRPATLIRTACQAVSGTAPNSYVPDTHRAQRELGLCPWISLEDGLRRMYRWCEQNAASEMILQ